MALAAGGCAILGAVTGHGRATKWIASLEPDAEAEAAIDIPDTREDVAVDLLPIARSALFGAVFGAVAAYVICLPRASANIVFITIAAAALLRAVIAGMKLLRDKPVVGEVAAENFAEDHKKAKHDILGSIAFAAVNLIMAWFP